MSKVKVIDVKPSDVVSFESKPITYYQNPIKLSGIISDIRKQIIRGEEYKYIQLFTDQGLKGAYLALTEEIELTVMSAEEKERIMVSNQVKTLSRVVDTQGSDPEMFVVDKEGLVVPAFKFLKDKKSVGITQPYWDGFQAEFNIHGVSCLDQTLSQLWSGLKNLHDVTKKYDKDARLTVKPTLNIPPHMLRDEKDEYVQFGCMPSKNVYGISGIKADGRDVDFRFAGGHIHLGLNSRQKTKIEEYVKALDAILGVACVSMFGKIDDPIRRKYYGLAGEYRTPSHGLEYRTLSNAWLCHPTISYIVFELARKVITLVDKDLFKHWQYNEADVISCINECNIPLAMEIINQNEDMFKDILQSLTYNQHNDTTQVIYKIFMGGVELWVSNPDDIEGNWKLNSHCQTGEERIVYMNNKSNYAKVLKMEF